MKQINFLLLLMILFSFELLNAVPAYREPILITQPDGSEITILLRGDEFFHYRTTTDGYLIKEDKDGFFKYASFDVNGKTQITSVRAKNLDKRTLIEQQFVRSLAPASEFMEMIQAAHQIQKSVRQKTPATTEPQKSYPLNGNPRSLVILVNFSDKNFVTANPQTAFTNLLNQNNYSTNGGTGSAKDYFRDNSTGAFDPIFDVVGPYTLPQNMAYYGGNNSSGDDKNPRQMIIDACTLANLDGVNFTQYDTDNDGFVDNVFVYYAGYNEAEGGPANTVWPHRWSLANYNTKFNGKIIFDYACTSELKGRSGSSMCGIGTFVHEFGHVLGLPDFYATDGATHFTLDYWDVMDAGPYLNDGRTPPAYSAYERFYLNWLTPIFLNSPQDGTLEALNTSNKAYLVSSTNTHNLNGVNPNPVEFFMLENRQKTGWDTFLPGKGMLATRVYYNSSTWNYNTVNNNPNSMGVDIIEADGVASSTTQSLAGDTYPGSKNVTSLNLTLRNGTDIDKPITNIEEINGVITFKFGEIKTPVAMAATDVAATSFTANWSSVSNVTKYLLDVYTVHVNETIYVQDYHNKDVGLATSVKIDNVYSETPYFYRVKSVNGLVVSEFSNEIQVNTLAYTFNMFTPIAIEASAITDNAFEANWAWNSELFTPDAYYLTVYSLTKGENIETEMFGFNGGVLPSGWNGNLTYSTASGFYGTSSPAISLSGDTEYLQTPLYDKNIKQVSFWYRGRSTLGGSFSLQIFTSNDGVNWNPAKQISPISTSASNITIDESEIGACKALKFVFSRPASSGNIVIDDVSIGFQTVEEQNLPNFTNKNVGTAATQIVDELNDATDYYYYLTASRNGEFTEKSNVMHVVTLTSNDAVVKLENSKIVRLKSGLNIQSMNNELLDLIEIYSVNGQKLDSKTNVSNVFIPIEQKGIYILKINNEAIKVNW